MDLELLKKLEVEEKEKLEVAYGVHIHQDALLFTCSILKRYSEVFMSNEEHGGNDNQLNLHERAIELLDKACAKLRNEVDTNVEENDLDRDEYFLHRAFVELTEIQKEKDHACRIWIPRVQKEYDDLRSKWEGFVNKWNPILMSPQRSEKRAQELHMLKQARQGLVSCLHEAEAVGIADAFIEAIQQPGALVFQLMQNIHDSFKQNLTVGPRMIAEAASSMTGVPVSLLLQFSELPLDGLGQRLSESLIGQEHVIRGITNALSKRKLGPRPIASFLFLGTPGCGRTEFSKALSQHLFGQEAMLIEFDMSEYMDSDSVSRLIGVRSSDKESGVGGQLTEAVKRRPFSVVMFKNVEKACASVTDVLLEILDHGRLMDGQEIVVDFSRTVIVMASSAADDKFRPLMACDCVKMVGKFTAKEIMKALPQEQKHKCYFLPLLREAERHFKPGLFEYLDDVIVLGWLSFQQFMSVIRLRLRDVASSMTKKGIILYPSEAALRSIVGISAGTGLFHIGAHAIRIWLEENLVPVLFDMLAKNEIDDMSIIYIDALLGTVNLSYRVEKSGVECQIYKQFKEFLRMLRTIYLKDKERVNKLYRLRRNFFNLITLLDGKAEVDAIHVSESVRDLVDIIDDLTTDACDVKLISHKPRAAPWEQLYNSESRCKQVLSIAGQMSTGSLNYNTSIYTKSISQVELRQKRPTLGVEVLCSKLRRGLVGLHPAIDVIAEAFLRSLDASDDMPHRPAKSFLFLGLTSVGKADLVKGLAENLVDDNGTKLLIEVDLSEYTGPDSFCRCTVNGQPGLQLGEAVRMRPHSVIVFYRLEMAHISVFSTLLSVLDHGVLNGSHSCAVDFRKTVVIFASDIGNKNIISQLVGSGYQDSVWAGDIKQRAIAFRAEFLNRVDEIVLFDPFANEQLRKVGRLSMRAGSHLEEGGSSALPAAFLSLFDAGCGSEWKIPIGMDPTVTHLTKGLSIMGMTG